MCLPRPFLWILMIASIEYWEALKGLQGSQAEACFIPQEEAMDDCEPFLYNEGDSLQLTCNIPSTNISLENVTNLEWFKDGNRLNNTTGSFFSKENLSLDDSGNYTCQLSGQTLSSHRVVVGGIKPYNIPQPRCVSRILGQYNCSWDEGNNFNLPTRYQLQFQYQSGSETITCTDTTGTNFCQIDAHMMKAGFIVSLCAENCLGHAKSSAVEVDPFGTPVVKPYPPSSVTMLPVSLTSMNITFDLPEGWVGISIGFYMSYTQSCTGYDDEAKEEKIGRKAYWDSRVFTVIELTAQPYSEVCIQIGYYYNQNYKPAAYSHPVCAHTPMATPSAAPEHFRHHYMNKTDYRNVNFTWQELDPCKSNGIIRKYILNLMSKTHNKSFEILGNRTSNIVEDLSWHEEYRAELYAVNDIGLSKAAVTIIPAAPSKLAWPVVLVIVFSSTLLLCFILSCFRLYFKVKKRVLPKVPEPTYYNKSFMTQVQYSHLSEPEVFDELKPYNVVERVQTSNSGEIPLINAATTSHDSDTQYNFSHFGSSVDSSPHTGSTDFAGLQAARPVNVQHNAYTSCPGTISTPPAVEDRTSDASQSKDQEIAEEDEEDPDAGPDEYARFALLPEDEVFTDEQENTSNENESTEEDRYKEDVVEPLVTDSRGLSYSSVTEVSADDIEMSPNVSDPKPTHGAYLPGTLKVTEIKSSQGDPPLSHKNTPNDGKPSLNVSPYQSPTDVTVSSDPSHCRLLLTPGSDQKQPTLESESVTPYADIVNQQQSDDRDRGQPTSDLYCPHGKVTESGGLEPEEDLNSFSYSPLSAGSTFSDPSAQDESFSTHSQNDGSDLKNTEEKEDPYITHEILVAGSKKSGDQTVKIEPMAAHSNTPLLPQADTSIPRPSAASKPTSWDDPYIPHDSGASGSNMKSCQDPYVSHESAAARSTQHNPSSQHPYVSQESRAQQPEPYVSHESAAARSAQLNPSSQDPYVSQESRAQQPDPYVSHESAAARSAQLNPSSQDPYVSQESRAQQPDPYVSHESAAARSAQLNPSSQDPYVSHESKASGPKSCQAVQPDPYVPHESAAVGLVPLNPNSEDDPYIPHESGESGSSANTCQALIPDPYISHDSAAAANTRQLNPSSQDDPLISQESGTNEFSTISCQALKPDLYISHESAATGPVSLNPTLQDDPYIPHESGASESYTNSCQAQQPDPYISHESTTARSAQVNLSSKDPFVSHESGASGPTPKGCKDLQPDPYVSHESAATGALPLNPVSEDDPYIPHESAANGFDTNTCQTQQPDPYISHESTTARSTQLNPPSNDPYVTQESGSSGPNNRSCQAVQPDPYVSHESEAA